MVRVDNSFICRDNPSLVCRHSDLVPVLESLEEAVDRIPASLAWYKLHLHLEGEMEEKEEQVEEEK